MGAGTLSDLRSWDRTFYCDHVEMVPHAVHMLKLFIYVFVTKIQPFYEVFF